MPDSLAFVEPPKKPIEFVSQESENLVTVKRRGCFPRWLVLLTISCFLAIIIACIVYYVNHKIKDPDPIQGWGEWSDWSACSTSCGEGSRLRSRECHPPDLLCLGSNLQAGNCYLGLCPKAEYGSWTTWGTWSECSKSCANGKQNRFRFCNKNNNQLHCIGEKAQTRECNSWSCPNCNRKCPSGGVVLPPKCERCICTGNQFTGHVKGITNLPLEFVEISERRLPNVVIAISDQGGNYSIDSACHGVELLMKLPDYTDKPHRMSSWNTITILEKYDPLTMYEHPEDKVRLIGDSLKLCCEAGGNPPPDYYEWFHNGRIMETNSYENDSRILVIKDLQMEHSGRYKCRASTDNQAVYSTEAVLKVKNSSEEFCLKTPLSDIVKLPVGCSFHGIQQLDVGRCPKKMCTNKIIGSKDCGYDTDSCCSASNSQRITVTCSGFNITYSVVKECGCVKCTKVPVQIIGSVLDSSTKEPIPFVQISVNKVHVASTNKYGYFAFTLENRTLVLPVAARDMSRRYTPATKIKHIPSDSKGTLFLKIHMIKRENHVTVSSDEDNVIGIGSPNPFGHILLPKNSVYDLNGILFSGEVEAFVNVLNPAKHTDFLATPGELGYIDEEGNVQRLHTFGMFSLDLQDRISKSPLQVRGKINIAFNNSKKTIPKLWSLNAQNGLWKLDGKMSNDTAAKLAFNLHDSSDTVVVGGTTIDIDKVWTNFDSDSERACHSKVRAFFTSEMDHASQIHGIEVMALTMMDDTTAEVSTIRAWSDNSGDDNGYCIVHLCETPLSPDTGYNGYIIAEGASSNPMPGETGTRLIPARVEELKWDDQELFNQLQYTKVGEGDTAGIKVNMKYDSKYTNGPFYNWSGEPDDLKKWAYSEQCSNSNESGNYFAFYAYDQSQSCKAEEIDIKTVSPGEEKAINYRAWFARSLENRYDVCYIKIMITNAKDRNFTAVSQFGTFSYEDPVNSENNIIPGETTYGFTTDCPENVTETPVCLEFKQSGDLSSGHVNDPHAEDQTLIDVYGLDESGAMSDKCTVTQIRQCLKDITESEDEIKTDEGDNHFKMLVTSKIFWGDDFGIFCGYEESPDLARLNVYKECMRSDFDQNTCVTDNDGKGWALKMQCTD